MNYIPIVILAYFLNGIAVIIDKILITKKIPDPLIYIFYFSLVSLLAFFFVPFVQAPSINVFLAASTSTLLWTSGAYFMLKALKIGQVSRVIPVIGTLIPVFLLIVGISTNSINNYQIISILFLVLGLIFLTVFDWQGRIKIKELVFELVSSLLFALSYLILREAYLMSNFLTVIVYSRLVLVPLGLTLILIPYSRLIIFPKVQSENQEAPYWKSFFKSKTPIMFAIGQLSAGASELLLTFSVSLVNPALVNSLQGTQYVFLFLASLILAKKIPTVFSENLQVKAITTKILGIICIGIGLYLLSFKS